MIAPLLFLLVLGMVELGRAQMVQQILVNGAREGARKAVLPGITEAQVHQAIDSYMSSCGLSGHTRTVSPSPTSAAAGASIRVTVSVPYNNASWLPLGAMRWIKGATASATAEMRKENF